MTMSETRDRGLLIQERGKGGGRAQPTADLRPGAWGDLGSIPIPYIPLALLFMLIMAPSSIHSMLDKLEYFPIAILIELCFGASVLFGYDDDALHTPAIVRYLPPFLPAPPL